ncbi:MAG: ABC transporter permease [Desulfovibrionaceae bacterium]|nr:ABC transporter permease [Desulfovibrionaceae bacterium]MDD4951018.1 ABC transporter permease [Desulfovibrionaceae bacterium]
MFLNLKIAVSSLATHKLRAVLAMLGVFLGALAFTGVQHVAKSMVKSAELETEKLGPNLFAVMAGQSRFHGRGGVRLFAEASNFTVSDALALMRQVPSVISGAPLITKSMPIRSGRNTVTCQVTATWPEYPDIRSHHAGLGRFFSRAEEDARAKVCVLGLKIAERLFGEPEKAIGRTVYIYKAGFEVVGVMEAKGQDLSGADQDEQVFVPLSTYMRRASNQIWISGVFLRLDKAADIPMVKAAAAEVMRRSHKLGPGEKDDFSLLSGKDAMQLQREALDLVQTLGMITSSVSFAVGGLGILSIMVLIVRSRRTEIGIRRAVGGRRLDIIRQFLFEAGIMAGCGGLTGVLASVAVVAGVCVFGGLPFVIEPLLLAATLAGSVALGLAAGTYPAWQASRIGILDVLKEN